jgi:hemerythrin-like domain-containing protein
MGTDNLRAQHEELLGIAAQIAGHLEPEELSNDARQVRSELNMLAGRIQVHLAIEDHALYPRMIGSNDKNVTRTAKKFQREMGTLAEAFRSFNEKWTHASRIQADPLIFVGEMRGIIGALRKRIERENRELYPLADAL